MYPSGLQGRKVRLPEFTESSEPAGPRRRILHPWEKSNRPDVRASLTQRNSWAISWTNNSFCLSVKSENAISTSIFPSQGSGHNHYKSRPGRHLPPSDDAQPAMS